MDLRQYVDYLRTELAVAAEAGGSDARALADRLTAPLESAVRLTLLNALSAAADEITSDLAPASVELRLRQGDPTFVVTQPPLDRSFDERPMPPAGPPPAPVLADPDDSAMARINFRLPESLKARVEEAASREGLSINAWLVRAAASALEPARPTGQFTNLGGQHYSGWVR